MATAAEVRGKRVSGVAVFKWTLLTPLIALFVFILPVFLLQLYFSFHSWTVYLGSWWDAEFVWFDTFIEVLTDAQFLWAIPRSLFFAGLSTLGCFVIGFGLALLMYRPFTGHGVFYAVFILPMLTVPIVIAYTFEMLLYQKGPINGMLSAILGTDVNVIWLADPRIAVVTVMLLEIWNWTPFAFIIMLAGLSALPWHMAMAGHKGKSGTPKSGGTLRVAYASDIHAGRFQLNRLAPPGYDANNPAEFTLLTNTDTPIFADSATLFKSQMEKIGVKVKLVVMDKPAMIDKFLSYNYQMAMEDFGALVDINQRSVSFFKGVKSNYGGLDSPEIEDLTMKWRRESSPEGRKQIAHDIQRAFAKDLLWCNITGSPYFQAYRDYVKGYHFMNQLYVRWETAWLDKA